MSQLERPKHDFEEIGLASFEGGQPWPQRRQERAVHRATFFKPKNIYSNAVLQELLVPLDGRRRIAQMSNAGVGGREQMIVNEQRVIGGAETPGAEILGRLQRHVALRAILTSLLWIIEGFRIMSGHTAQEIRVVMI